MSDAYLALEDGRVIEARGRSPGQTRGELVFTTAYTGYEESLTDPSYEEQVLTFSYPLIGNYGVREERFESDRIHPRAAIAHEFTEEVVEWLDSEDVPAIDHIDTRDLVTSIREEGAMKCGIAVGDDVTPADAEAQLAKCKGMSEHTEIGAQVSTVEHETYRGGGEADVALIDCGAKMSIVDSLNERGADVHVLPHDTTAAEVEELDPDLLFISNGPGDPANFGDAQALVEEFVGEIPLAGICLGQQVIARALGGTTEKMDFGHRGVNQPVRDLNTGKVIMTTQNHGYTVDEPGDLNVTQVNVNDDTAEGLENAELNVITRQYHPEAHPGPHDSLGFFDDVLGMVNGTEHKLVADD
ncbi:carbamoyl phosphate synthase small subunit [Halogeometricum borinquense DSM 11551]|uniref:Carbamoyl phosphate synthase small chain n=2 Tax=Halogeometricum borinquense TaxID=60847 RepID=E4NPE6_HALBP|nr:glutamine-hydrolyzing carbamoyl-phosphate synthase small subunit [Halogeometricum borinquense]ADQ66501.1 carbamoyl-phosphate synthase small subunit [Halogeometricum borinquense DSM 11551]ELY30976.1 carbamoyl phosphate synthase small subunit [Halogeometricum borinquense DSM 11551]RYJ14365.1 carbamoyl-phosphate synthase small subunit [Halogeometricum borinquense]